MLTLTSVEAQNRFGQLLDLTQREPVTITRRGRPVAMLIAPQDYAALQRGQVVLSAATTAQLAARNAIAAFRGAGQGGTVEQLLADRRVDTLKE